MILKLQNAILEMIAKGEPLATTVEHLCIRVEALVPDVTVSVLTFDGRRLYPLAGPRFHLAIQQRSKGWKADLWLVPAGRPHFSASR